MATPVKTYQVLYPRTPGEAPSVRSYFVGNLAGVRRAVRRATELRADLSFTDVRIVHKGVLVEYAGPARKVPA